MTNFTAPGISGIPQLFKSFLTPDQEPYSGLNHQLYGRRQPPISPETWNGCLHPETEEGPQPGMLAT